MARRDTAFLRKVTVSLPFGLGSAEWETDVTQRRAAWSLYVELVTRVAIQPLQNDQGLLRETLISLYSIFETTRVILKEAGPDVGASRSSLGGIAITVLNSGIRPFLTKWHPKLQAWEVQKPEGLSLKEHESNWTEKHTLYTELNNLRQDLDQYAKALAIIAGVD
uniref:Uncharacterized protein n=1 Tax=Cyanothece sp. (strain PCC 7425 / ATCC 29141) TaxID=395961 RepID=B8HPE4_CYAP4